MKLRLFRDAIKPYVRDEKILNLDDYNAAIDSALSFYSQLRPKPMSQTIAVDQKAQIATSALTEFDEAFFHELNVEYPILTTAGVQTYIDRQLFALTQSDSGQVLRFYALSGGVTVRVVHYATHKRPVDDETEMTVRNSDESAVIKWAAAESLQMLADRYSGQSTEQSILSADIANFVSKGRDCEERAKTLRAQVYDHFAAASRRGQARIYRG